MATYLKQSTAVDIALGPFVDSTDGFTAETALTIAQADVRLKKNAGAWAQKSETTSATHEENGWYEVNLDATDTGTLGILVVAVNETGALPVWREFMVVPANVYDSIVGGSDTLDVQVTGMGAGVVTAAAIATDAIDDDALAADAVTAIQSGLGTAANQATIASYIDTEVASILTAVDTEVAAIKAKTDNLPAVPASQGDITALNNLSAAQVNAEVVDALSTDTYAELTDVPAATSSLKDKITWLFMLARNKIVQSATTGTIYADDGTTPLSTTTVSDDGTDFTRGEWTP